MSPGGRNGVNKLIRTGQAAGALVVITGLLVAVGGWARGEMRKVAQEESAKQQIVILSLDKTIAEMARTQASTNETLTELVTVMVAPPAVRERAAKRLQAKYVLGPPPPNVYGR